MKKNFLFFVIAVLFFLFGHSAQAAVCTTSLSADTPASAATWSCGHIPANGDSVLVSANGHLFTWDQAATIGEGANSATVGSGTISKISNQFTVTGSGTSFNSEVEVGDWIVPDSVPAYAFIVQSVANNTSITCCNYFGYAFTNSTYKIYRHGIAVFGSWTTSAPLTVKGHVFQGLGGNTTINANLTLATSIAPDGQPYFMRINTGEGGVTGGLSIGAVTVGTDGGPNTYIADEINTTTLSMIGTTLSGFGSSTYDGVGLTPVNTTMTGVKLALVDGTAAGGTIYLGKYGTLGATANVHITGTQILSVAPGATPPLNVLKIYGGGGSNIHITDNLFDLPNFNIGLLLISTGGMEFQRNLYNRLQYYDGAATINDNVTIVHPYPAGIIPCNPWSFVGDNGTVVTNMYFVEDEGVAQSCERGLMSSDNPSSGTWTLQNFIYETTGPSSLAVPVDWIHTRPPITSVLDHILTLPMSDGTMPGDIYNRDGTIVDVTHSTLVTNAPGIGGVSVKGAINNDNNASNYPLVKNNLGWAKAGSAALGITNTLLQNCPTCTTANLLAAGGITNNAHYNSYIGHLYDPSGTTPTAALGYDGWRQTVKPSLSADVNLGSGTNENTQGPRFVDSTRNYYLFDSAYLGHAAGAWQNTHSYNVGDLVSASTPGFYNGATINYRCIKAHTSVSGNTTNGQPGVAANYRTNWEPATTQDLRNAILSNSTITDSAISCINCTYSQALSSWVRKGFTPQNPTLWCSSDDGDTIGAVSFCTKGKTLLSATAF